ncbi:MAG: DVUA0089 family protein [Kofleriaceae bacterium]|nr:DVUA0089 family protein [Kofleriaceae bacterium]
MRLLPMRLASIVLATLLAPAALAGCLAGDDKGEEDELPADLDKADSFRAPTNHGVLPFAVKATAELTSAERYHAWTFDLSADATVNLTTSYAVLGQRRTDTVLYLYRQGPTGSWGPYLARNDDYGNTDYSQLIRTLPAGRYRALVKGYASTTRGKFGLTGTCQGAGCAAPDSCLFGETYGDLADNPALAILNRNVITAATLGNLTADDQAQLVIAVQQSAHTDVTTAAEAISRVDQGEINVSWVLEQASRRTFIAYEYGAGDNSYGAIFERRSGDKATSIHDGDLLECTARAAVCTLPDDYAAMKRDSRFTLRTDRAITAASQLSAAEAAQVRGALVRTYGALASIDDGLALADDDRVNLRTYRDTATSTDLTVVEFGAGDTSMGAVYPGASADPIALISDLFVTDCTI